jgi:hypothetical protein
MVYFSNIIQTIYPRAKISSRSPGVTGNLVVKVNGNTVW